MVETKDGKFSVELLPEAFDITDFTIEVAHKNSSDKVIVSNFL